MNTKKIISLAVAGFVGLMGISVNAVAAEGNPATIDANHQGSITIHKYYGDETDVRADGLAKEIKGKDPVEGVKYKVEKAEGIDLTTNQGWKDAAAASKNGGKDLKFTVVGSEQITSNTGEAKFSDLPVGLYRVTETDVTGAKVKNEAKKVKAAAPFLVTVPLTDPTARDKWIYDLHVYPKNAEFQVKKTADLSKVKEGKMVYDVYSTLPALADGKQEYEKYALIDQLGDAFDPTSFKVLKLEVVADESDASGTEIAAAGYKVENATSPVKVNVVGEGLKSLTTAKKANKNQVHFKYEVAFKAEWNKGVATNKAFVNPDPNVTDDAAVKDPNTPSSPENEVKFANLKIHKINEAGDTGLSGAEFDVYACTADGKLADAKGEVVASADKALKLNNEKLVSTATGDTNTVRIVTKDNTTLVKNVCAVETKAPEGYTLLNEPVQLSKVTGTDDVTEAIKNVEANAGFKLPLTGSSALIALTIAGLALIAGSSIYVLRRKDSKK